MDVYIVQRDIANMIMKISEIDKAVEDNKCPERMFCTVATTCYDNHTRERKCLKCWLDYCKANNIEIDYGEVA